MVRNILDGSKIYLHASIGAQIEIPTYLPMGCGNIYVGTVGNVYKTDWWSFKREGLIESLG